MVAGGDLTTRIKEYARAVGFDAVGVARAEPFAEDRAVLRERIAAGHFSGLSWFTGERADFSSDPRNLLPTARSIISLAMSYRPQGLPQGDAGVGEQGAPRGRISAYAWGRDYHAVLKERMERVVAFMRDACGPAQQARTLVDTARILDRAAARRAGVGWVGKHSNVITKAAGSWVFLGEILTELELEPDEPLRTNCGSCDLCMRACPTGAIVAPYVVDSNRCISYLTIEHRGAIPRELRPLMGNWIFGCDLCQEVCPPNLRPGVPAHEEFRCAGPEGPDRARAGPTVRAGSGAADPAPEQDDASPGTPELIPLLTISPEEFRRRFGRTPVKRAKREGLQRNVAVALGNSGNRAAVPALAHALREAAPLVRAHAAWALGRIGGADAVEALRSAFVAEGDGEVRAEIEAALAELG
jgi:epoxyqueuosine reductase